MNMNQTPAAVRRILEERARRIARPREVPGRRAALPLLTLGLGSGRYALDARSVVGVRRLEHFTPLPGAPPEVAGITSWRGDLLTVLDLEKVLGITRTGLDDRAWVVVVQVDGARLGLLASTVGQVVDVSDETLEPSDSSGPRADELVLGRTADARTVLNPKALFTAPDKGEKA